MPFRPVNQPVTGPLLLKTIFIRTYDAINWNLHQNEEARNCMTVLSYVRVVSKQTKCGTDFSILY